MVNAVLVQVPISKSTCTVTRLGNTALVLVTRVKDLGNGWEPLFYSLLWTRQDLTWRLSREFVHQRTVPNWR